VTVSPGYNAGMMTTEGRTLEVMIKIFCRGHHGNKEELCPDCRELLEYAQKRLDKCPFGENKPRCSDCTVHCYKPEMREKIRAVMKYSGPRMVYKHPVLTGAHYIKRK
jgi:predicted amidophosphoribosyltransferase